MAGEPSIASISSVIPGIPPPRPPALPPKPAPAPYGIGANGAPSLFGAAEAVAAGAPQGFGRAAVFGALGVESRGGEAVLPEGGRTLPTLLSALSIYGRKNIKYVTETQRHLVPVRTFWSRRYIPLDESLAGTWRRRSAS